jgi:hypothetical protein
MCFPPNEMLRTSGYIIVVLNSHVRHWNLSNRNTSDPDFSKCVGHSSVSNEIAFLIFVNTNNIMSIYFGSKFVPSILPLIILEPVVLETLEMTMINLKFSLFDSKEMQHMRH